jgi:hypothetical protein
LATENVGGSGNGSGGVGGDDGGGDDEKQSEHENEHEMATEMALESAEEKKQDSDGQKHGSENKKEEKEKEDKDAGNIERNDGEERKDDNDFGVSNVNEEKKKKRKKAAKSKLSGDVWRARVRLSLDAQHLPRGTVASRRGSRAPIPVMQVNARQANEESFSLFGVTDGSVAGDTVTVVIGSSHADSAARIDVYDGMTNDASAFIGDVTLSLLPLASRLVNQRFEQLRAAEDTRRAARKEKEWRR